MSDYRLYLIGADGKVVKAVELNCEDDKAAKASARELLLDGCEAELWQRVRPVAKFDQMTARDENAFPVPAVANFGR
jgi:hypothetical protein